MIPKVVVIFFPEKRWRHFDNNGPGILRDDFLERLDGNNDRGTDRLSFIWNEKHQWNEKQK